jgi:thiol:disulfide interchange protein DsbD
MHMKWSIYLLTLIFCMGSKIQSQENSFLYENNKILPAEEVFKINVSQSGNKIVIEWDIKDKYYLYSDSIKINRNNNTVEYVLLKSDKYKIEDEFFGKTEIYKNFLSVYVDNNDNLSNYVILYQGCAEAGFCYPVQKYFL